MITGIFSDMLERAAIWFLYIFIAADAPLNDKIMRKRSNQIKWLKRLDAINAVYSYGDLVNIVEQGIVKRYGKTPAQLLANIYNTATTGIRSTENPVAAIVETAKDLDTGKVENKNFWQSLDDVITFIREILKILGIQTSETDIKPMPQEWQQPNRNTGLASVGDILPWVLTGTIIYSLYKSSDKKPKKENI